MFDPKTVKVTHQWKHDAPLMWCRFDPNGEYVFATSEDQSIQRWRLSDEQKTPLAAHESWVRDLAFSPDGATMVSAGCDDKLIWWPVGDEKPQAIRQVKAHVGWIRAVAVSPNSEWVASGGNDRIVKLWSLATGELVRELTGHAREIYSLAFDPSGKYLLSGDLVGDVRQWEIATGKLERSFEAKALHSYNGGQQVDYGGVRSMAFSPNGQHLACGGLHNASNPLGAVNDPLVLRFQWSDGKLLTSHVAAGVKGAIWRCCFAPDGMLIGCSGGSGGGFLIYWGEADKEVHKLKLPDTARGMDLHPDGKRQAAALHRGELCICQPQ